MIRRFKVTIPTGRINVLFSRGSGNGGQNLHASNSRCMLKFDINKADWMPLSVRDAFIRTHGEYISSRGTVVIVREDTRSATDNEKLAMKQLQAMIDKAEEISKDEKPIETFSTERERIESTKTKAQIEKYKDTIIESKKIKSHVKRNRNLKDWE